ncbi:membrane protein [Mycobacteroides abscessus subsp. abscessus]|uniref:type VII secretion protein EccE n=1 Tax=Mycobacteroides abscessus TaxID=36809 RepID=UPI0009A74C91|nr:type VII secretion protein EccE [Mycobacteroides abscessus]SKO34692.1 membrane protein [Mycobacteroides abscessus subsp. abscessus]
MTIDSDSGHGLRRWTKHQPPVSPGIVTAAAIANTAIGTLGGPAAGLAAAVVTSAGLLVPVVGRTGYEWLQVARRNRTASYRGEIPAPPADDEIPTDKRAIRRRELIEQQRAQLDEAEFAKWERVNRNAEVQRLIAEDGYGRTATVTADRTGGGVRYQDGTAVVAIHVLGEYLAPTLMTGDTSHTTNVLHTRDLAALMRQPLGLGITSLSVVTIGARVRASGDYAPTYHTFVGPPPYAGQREMWLIIRIATDETNVDGLSLRPTVGKATLSVAQRALNVLRTKGIRAKVATATDLADLDAKLGGAHALEQHNRTRHAVRSDGGWLTSFYYPPQHINDADLSGVWSLRADQIIQNVTLLPGGRCTAAVTILDPQIVPMAPSVALSPLPGEQAAALAMCRPMPADPVGGRAALAAGPPNLALPVRGSGVLVGRLDDGYRIAVPFTDPETQLRISVEADDTLAKRLIMRCAATGERVTIHTQQPARWQAMSMPGVIVTTDTKPAAGTTISVTDGRMKPTPAPGTVIGLGEIQSDAHMTFAQIGSSSRLSARIPDPEYDPKVKNEDQPPAQHRSWEIEMDLFEDENPYAYSAIDAPRALGGTGRHHA